MKSLADEVVDVRLSQLEALRDVSDDEMREGLQFFITSSSLCAGCKSGEHQEARRALIEEKPEWYTLEGEYRHYLEDLNDRLEPFGIKRTFLCYFSESDESFEEVRIYNMLADEATYEMLQELRFGAPFHLLEVDNLEDFTFEERQIAAAAFLYVHASDVDDEKLIDEAEKLIAMVAVANPDDTSAKLKGLETRLPEYLRIPAYRVDEMRDIFQATEELAAQGGVLPFEVLHEQISVLHQRYQEDHAEELRKEVTEHQSKFQQRWGFKDRGGKTWRLRGEPSRWERLSMRFSVSRAFNGEPLFTPKIKDVHRFEAPQFVPDIDFEKRFLR